MGSNLYGKEIEGARLQAKTFFHFVTDLTQREREREKERERERERDRERCPSPPILRSQKSGLSETYLRQIEKERKEMQWERDR